MQAVGDLAHDQFFIGVFSILQVFARLKRLYCERLLPWVRARSADAVLVRDRVWRPLVFGLSCIVAGVVIIRIATFPVGLYVDLPQDLQGRRQRAREASR